MSLQKEALLVKKLPNLVTLLGSAPFQIENIIYHFTKRATLMRGSTVLILPPFSRPFVEETRQGRVRS
jgi:hypothetical protein